MVLKFCNIVLNESAGFNAILNKNYLSCTCCFGGDYTIVFGICLIDHFSQSPSWNKVVSKYNLRMSRAQYYNPTYSPIPIYICNTKVILSYDQYNIQYKIQHNLSFLQCWNYT